MKITRHQQSWVLRFNNTLAQRTVLTYAGLSLSDGKKYYRLDISAKHNREAINWLVAQRKRVTLFIERFRYLF